MGPYPDFLRLTAHPVRWSLLGALARTDLRVSELTALTGASQNLVSYHLGKLRAGHLVSARRSAADARDTYYSLDLGRCADLLAETGGSLHPALALVPPTPPPGRRVHVLFLCTGNSARSQMAEAFVRHATGGLVDAHSAGSHPTVLHPDAVAAMAGYGIDISGQRTKHLDELRGKRFSVAVTLCDRVREICPELPAGTERIHWSVPDPARSEDGYPAFQRVAAELRTRVGFLLHRLRSTVHSAHS